MTTTVTPKTNKLVAFRQEDVRDQERLRARLNDVVAVIRATQQNRQVFVKAAQVKPTIGATFSTWSVAIPPIGFCVGGVVLTGFRVTNIQQPLIPCPWAIDFLTLPDGGIQIQGAVANAVYAVPPTAYYTATFLLIEDS